MSLSLNNVLQYIIEHPKRTIEFYERKKIIKKNFKELYDDIVRLYNFLKEKHIKEGAKIGILAENSYEYVVIDITCLVGGWISVLFHETYFSKQSDTIIDKYNLDLLIVHKKYIDKKNDEKVIYIEDLLETISGVQGQIPLKKHFNELDVFSVTFTSGTTGSPKALRIKPKGLQDLLTGINEIFSFYSEDKVLIFLPLSVLACKTYIYGAIYYGFNMAICNSNELNRSLALSKPTILQGIPLLFEMIYNSFVIQIRNSKLKLGLFKTYSFLYPILPNFLSRYLGKQIFKPIRMIFGGNIRFMITGSAPINKKVLLFFKLAGINLYEAYGTNECGLISINYPGKEKIGSVGTLFKNRDAKLDENGQVLVLNDGSIHDGYEDYGEDKLDTDLNCGVGAYIATGDVGYFDNNSFLFLKGRLLDVITLSNGEKIHPSHFENKLKSSDIIKQVCVLSFDKDRLSCILVTVDKDIAQNKLKELINESNKDVADYMRITSFIHAEEPFSTDNNQLNVNLKLNRDEIEKVYKEKNRIYI